jgi:DNA-binding transcriptional regulator YhcF (GntR family)
MEFYIEKNSSTPAVNQIEEQIKFAVMMGIFRNGDTLPSIRDIEKQTGVKRSQIHQAYQALRRSGLLVLTHGKGTVVSAAADSPRSIVENCRKLSKKTISTLRQLGISPIAFTRYLSQDAQESERNLPLILYADDHEEFAVQTAAEISQLWQVPVMGLAFRNLKTTLRKVAVAQRILVNHVMCEYVRSLLSRKKYAVIPIEVRVSEQTVKLLAQIKPHSSVLIIHLPQPSHRAHFIVAQLREFIKSPGVKIFSTSIRNMSSFRKLLNSSQYDYYLIGPGVRGDVPPEMRQDPRIVQIHPQLVPASLEAARIRAGVVI